MVLDELLKLQFQFLLKYPDQFVLEFLYQPILYQVTIALIYILDHIFRKFEVAVQVRLSFGVLY